MATGLGEALQEIQVANGLEMAAIVSADGLVVEAATADDVDAESICSVASNGMLMMDALAQELREEQARVTTLEYAHHLVVMAPLDEDSMLVLLSNESMNLGRLRIVLRRAMDSLGDALGAV
jgi:predicted regulator of Ras-like GTPase activity (Roadblock/LC7/MglB family)